MKSLFISLCFASLLFAQEAQEMEKMMQEMQKMQACMAKIDFNSLAKLQEKSFAVQKEIEKKCENKQEKEAQKIALDFISEIKTLPAIVQMQECSKNSPMGKMLEIDNPDTGKICSGTKTDFGLPNKQRVNW